MIYFLLILEFLNAGRLILRNIENRDFELSVPRDIKFNVAYVYNNNLNKVSDTVQKSFALEISRTENGGELFYFTMPERTKPNLYYGVYLEDQNGTEHFSNRYYCATNDEFYTDKSAAPKREQLHTEGGFLSRVNWVMIGIVILAIAMAAGLAGLGYIALQKYKKRRNNVRVDTTGTNRKIRFE